MALLKAVEGPLRGQSFKVPEKDRVVVGRYEIYDLVVPDPSISRKHFALEQRPDGMYLVDLGSLNGTQLNGHRVSTARLETGDKVAAGQSVLEFDESGAAGGVPKIERPVAAAPAAPEPAAGGAVEEVVEVLPEAGGGEAGGAEEVVVEVLPEAGGGEAGGAEEVVVEVLAEVDEGEAGGEEVVVEVLAEVDEGDAGEEVVEVLAEVAEPQGAEGVEQVSDEDIVFDPAVQGGADAPQTVPMKAAGAEPAEKARRARVSGSAQTKRTTRGKDSGGKKGSGRSSIGRCAACGRKVTQEDLDSGAAEKVPQGYVCDRCVKKHADAGGGTTLEQFVVERKRRRRRR
ncbi:MAG: FHA domain-containing protein [Planctomycetota bacterium]